MTTTITLEWTDIKITIKAETPESAIQSITVGASCFVTLKQLGYGDPKVEIKEGGSLKNEPKHQ